MKVTTTGVGPKSTLFRLAALTGASAVLLDLDWNLVVSRPHQFSADLFLWPVLVLFITSFTLVTLAWWIAHGLGDRRVPGAAASIVTYVALFIPTWTLFFNLSESRLFPGDLGDQVNMLIVTSLAAAISVVLGRLPGLREGSSTRQFSSIRLEYLLLLLVSYLLVLLPVLLAELMWIEGIFSVGSVLAITLAVVACFTLSWIFVRQQQFFRVLVFGLLTMCLSVLVIMSAQFFDSPRLEASGPIKHQTLPPIVLITIDTLRADSLGSYGSEKGLTPNLDALARKSLLFERTFASSPWTLPSMASIMTGVSALVHQTPDRSPDLPLALPTLAEALQNRGYVTLGIGRNAHLRGSTGFSRGFDYYRFYPRTYLADSLGTQLLRAILPGAMDNEATTSELARRARKLVEDLSEEPFFLWLHIFDPHIPYEPPEEFLSRSPELARFGARFEKVREVRSGRLFPDSDQQEWIRRLYEGEIRYVDHEIGQFLSTLERLDLFDPALIVVSSDHGEEFWEHGGFEHGHALNNEVIGVPLIIKPPRTSAAAPHEAKRIATPVSITSIRSTMLEVAQAPAASSTLPLGESLVPHWTPASFESSEDPIVIGAVKYFGQQLSLVRGSYKYIRHLEDGREELYDLVVDPDESDNLAFSQPDLTLELSEALDREVEEGRRIADELGIGQGSAEVHMDKETERELRSLGYIE